MAHYKNITEYRKAQQSKIKKLKTYKRRGPITAAKFMVARSRQWAPRNTGNVIRNIRRQRNKVLVGGSNPINGFPYIYWINAVPGYERVKIIKQFRPKGLKKEHGNKKYSFVELARRKSTFRFYYRALKSTRLFYRRDARNNIRKIFSSKF